VSPAIFTVRELKSTDAEALLTFESLNRAWFESHIDARDPAFYSLSGVGEHIACYLSGFNAGTWHPHVIEDSNGSIVGRANLKCIDSRTGSAEVGYRIAEHVCGQGVATLALRHLVEEAKTRWGLTQLVAYVFKENTGSMRVLDRCGFLPDHGSRAATGERRFVLPIRPAIAGRQMPTRDASLC